MGKEIHKSPFCVFYRKGGVSLRTAGNLPRPIAKRKVF